MSARTLQKIAFYTVIIIQLILTVLYSIDAINYFTGLELVNIFDIMNAGFPTTLFEAIQYELTIASGIVLYGLILLLFPKGDRFYHRMRPYGFTMMLFGLIPAVFTILYYTSEPNLITAIPIVLIYLVVLGLLIASTLLLPAEKTAEKEHKRLVIIVSIAVSVIFLSTGVILFDTLVLMFFPDNPSTGADVIRATEFTILSLLFISIIFSTMKVYDQVYLEAEDMELYPVDEIYSTS